MNGSRQIAFSVCAQLHKYYSDSLTDSPFKLDMFAAFFRFSSFFRPLTFSAMEQALIKCSRRNQDKVDSII